MCGIAGIFRRAQGEWHSPPSFFSKMMGTMRHRGPDRQEALVRGPLCIGVNRLSIVDPHQRSNQPFISKDRRFILAFNGEIYNFRLLRKELENTGCCFKTQGDAEVLLEMYIKYGSDCLHKLRGMFVFAVWDSLERELFIARDRLGEKPLYYHENDGDFIFASELPPLLACPLVPRQMNPAAMHAAMYYMHSPAPETPFTNIFKLEPGHFLKVTGDSVIRQRYWSARVHQDRMLTDRQDCIEAIRACLDDTVSMMCRCDTRVGALLSGGLDSSGIVASMAAGHSSFPTFRISAGSGPDAEAERQSARLVARQFGCDHFEFKLASTACRNLENIVRLHGEPIATAVPIDAFALAGEVSRHVRTALCGAGADELFGGYRDHQLLHQWDLLFADWHRIEQKGRGSIPAPANEIERLGWELFDKVGRTSPELVFPRFRYANQNFFQKIYSPKMKEVIREEDPIRHCLSAFNDSGSQSLFSGFISQQLSCASQYCLAEINDRAGMAHSIEVRSPFLDVEMVELALRIPAEFKVDKTPGGQGGKNILREALGNRLPKETLTANKIPYGGTTPYPHWLREDENDFFEKKLNSEALADSGLYDPAAIQELYTLYQCGVPMDHDLFFGLAATAIWLETFF